VATDRFSQTLVVEDNPADLKRLCEILRVEKYQVIGCTSAKEALTHVQQCDFGVAVVDYRLPDLSGTQLLERIREYDRHVRVILYTGPASYDSIKEAMDLGAFAYVERLDDSAELVRHVHRAHIERVDRYAMDLEEAVAARTEELARSNRELDDFASVVAHDLRSPLLTISGYCQLIFDEYGRRFDDACNEYLGQIVAGATRMNRLIEDLLEYSRAGRSSEPFRPIDMQTVVVLAMANLEASIQLQEAVVEVGPMPTVNGNQTQLVQLMQNLLGNAIKFRYNDPPHVQITAKPHDRGWLFSVADNGIGIAPEHFEVIFKTFHRLHGREYPGTGIGLAVCKKIVERHGGRIWLTSESGRGATFHFTIPG
jgi:two-component system, sensor histidine kinase and response regulator